MARLWRKPLEEHGLCRPLTPLLAGRLKSV
jgi:hypothetical protein